MHVIEHFKIKLKSLILKMFKIDCPERTKIFCEDFGSFLDFVIIFGFRFCPWEFTTPSSLNIIHVQSSGVGVQGQNLNLKLV